MTLWEYVIAVEAGKLLRASGTRKLTQRESELLDELMTTVDRLAREEAARDRRERMKAKCAD